MRSFDKVFVYSLVFLSFIFSFVALLKSFQAEKSVFTLQSQVVELTKHVAQISKDFKQGYDALDAHLTYIDELAHANYIYFYGDNVKLKDSDFNNKPHYGLDDKDYSKSIKNR